MRDVVRTDAYFAWLVLSGIVAFVVGVLIVAGVIPFPFWVGLCGLVGGASSVYTARRARRLFRSTGKG